MRCIHLSESACIDSKNNTPKKQKILKTSNIGLPTESTPTPTLLPTSYLHAITNSQHRHIPLPNQLPNSIFDMRRPLLIHRIRPAAEYDSRQFMSLQFVSGYQTGVQLAVDVEFAYATRD